MKLDFEIEVVQQSRARDQTFERVLDSGCPPDSHAHILSPKSKKSPAFFGFWAQNFFGGLNQKSATDNKCKIHIYIDSESFRQIR